MNAIQKIQAVLTPDLLSKKYKGESHPLGGHCYVATEALYHALGGKASGFKAFVARDGDRTHWWLQRSAEERLDVTAPQYTDLGLTPPYEFGRGCGFLTKTPSHRARTVLERAKL
jgi:hypothetical protein